MSDLIGSPFPPIEEIAIGMPESRLESGAAKSSGLHVYDNGHTGTQRTILAEILGDRDPDRHSLNHFGEVARRVVRGQQRELRARRRTHAFDPPLHGLSLVRIDVEIDFVANADLVELRLLEV